MPIFTYGELSSFKIQFTECVIVSINNDGKIIYDKAEAPESFNCRKTNNNLFQCFILFKSQKNTIELILNRFENSQSKFISQNNRNFLNIGEKNIYFRSAIVDRGEKICTGKLD